MGMTVLYVLALFHLPSSIRSLVIDINSQGKERFYTAAILSLCVFMCSYGLNMIIYLWKHVAKIYNII